MQEEALRENQSQPLQKSYGSGSIFRLAFFILCAHLIINLFNGYVLGLGYPYNTFLLFPGDRFADFFKVIDAYHIVETWAEPNPYDYLWNFYAIPFGTVYYYFFAVLIRLTGNQYAAYLILNIALIGLHALLARKRGNSFALILLSILSYPVLFTIDRGNYAFAVYLLILFALLADNIILASVAVAFAASLKVTPIIFIVPVMFMKDFTFKRGVIAGAVLLGSIALITYFSIRIIESQVVGAPFSISEFTKLISFYYKEDVSNLGRMFHNNSLYLPILYLFSLFDLSEYFTLHVRPIDLPIVACLFVLIVITVKKQFRTYFFTNLNGEKLVFITCISFVLFMPVTADYYLLILFIPLLLFPDIKYSLGYFVIYALLLAPKNIFFFHLALPGTFPISYQVLINPLLLLVLFIAEFGLLPGVRRSSSSMTNGAAMIPALYREYQTVLEFIRMHYRKVLSPIVIVASMTVVLTLAVRHHEMTKHNIQMGLPMDFDPDRYLQLNPELIEFWRANGIQDTGQALRDRAEIHYRDFGRRDNWRYK